MPYCRLPRSLPLSVEVEPAHASRGAILLKQVVTMPAKAAARRADGVGVSGISTFARFRIAGGPRRRLCARPVSPEPAARPEPRRTILDRADFAARCAYSVTSSSTRKPHWATCSAMCAPMRRLKSIGRRRERVRPAAGRTQRAAQQTEARPRRHRHARAEKELHGRGAHCASAVPPEGHTVEFHIIGRDGWGGKARFSAPNRTWFCMTFYLMRRRAR